MQNDPASIVTLRIATTGKLLGPSGIICLSDEEKTHSHRLRQAGDRERFLAARTLLRHALSEEMDGKIQPEQWRFRDNPNGKPVMAPGFPQLEFNLSHTGDCVAVAISASGPVGIDVESVSKDADLEIVSDVLSMREREYLSRMQEQQKWESFLQFWTLKEACAKAMGLGASIDFRRLEVNLGPLSVNAPEGLLGTGETFDIESRVVELDHHPYRLGVAKITSNAGETSFCLKP